MTTVWDWLWIGWLVVFLAIELPAAIGKKLGGTLSEHIWSWFSTRTKGRWWIARRATFMVFWVVLGWHFITGSSVVWVIVTGIPTALVIGLAEFWERRDRVRRAQEEVHLREDRSSPGRAPFPRLVPKGRR